MIKLWPFLHTKSFRVSCFFCFVFFCSQVEPSFCIIGAVFVCDTFSSLWHWEHLPSSCFYYVRPLLPWMFQPPEFFAANWAAETQESVSCTSSNTFLQPTTKIFLRFFRQRVVFFNLTITMDKNLVAHICLFLVYFEEMFQLSWAFTSAYYALIFTKKKKWFLLLIFDEKTLLNTV